MDEMEPTVEHVDWETEPYLPKPRGVQDEVAGSTELAQLIYDSGLVYMVNCAVLHPQGLALGVSVTEGAVKRVTGLNLHRTSDPEGVWFDEPLTSTGRRKLLNAGLLLRGHPRQSGAKDIRPERDTQDDDDVWRRTENVKRVLTERGVRLHDTVIDAIVNAACDPKLRPQSSDTDELRIARHDEGQVETRALTMEEHTAGMETQGDSYATYGVWVGGALWCVCFGDHAEAHARTIAQGVEQFA